MATINDQGTIQAKCVGDGCNGAVSSFEWRSGTQEYGVIKRPIQIQGTQGMLEHRLFRCAGCGMGAVGAMSYPGISYPGKKIELHWFTPEGMERLPLPKDVPEGIKNEFREGELCLQHDCVRAAAGMFRSVLDKTLRANGYKVKKGTPLEQQIDLAAKDGVITASRQRRAHDEIRVLGNDVLHDEWREIPKDDALAARQYAQRILEDFYDDRPSTLTALRAAGRIPDEDRESPASAE